MEIKVGQYYALESTEEGSTEVNIIKILPNKPNMLDVFCMYGNIVYQRWSSV